MENGEGSPSRASQGRARSADGVRTRVSSITFSRNCQSVSPVGLQSHPFVHGAPNPFLLTPQTARCVCSRRKDVCRCMPFSFSKFSFRNSQTCMTHLTHSSREELEHSDQPLNSINRGEPYKHIPNPYKIDKVNRMSHLAL